jgi:hypothetical protein
VSAVTPLTGSSCKAAGPALTVGDERMARMSRRLTIILRGGHEIVLQGVEDQEAERLVRRFAEVFEQGEPKGSTTVADGTLIRHSEVVGVRNTSEQSLSNRSGGRA